MSSPAANFPTGMPGEPASPIPYVRSGTPQPTTHVAKPKVVRVKSHTRTIRPKAPAQPPADPYAAAVNSAANLKYGPQIQATQQQVANAQAGQINAQNWYHDYQNTLVAQQAALAQQAQGLAKALGGYAPQAAQTGNAQADALAQQAAQSQHYLGQSFAGTQGQMAQNVANQFSTGLIPGAALRSQDVQQGLTNQIGQLQQQRGQLLGQEGDYKTQVRGQLQAATQKEADTQAGLQIKQGTLNYLQGNAQAKVKVQRTNARTQRMNAQTQQTSVQDKAAADQASRQAKSEAQSLSRAQFKAKYGIAPDQALKMSPGQWSHYAKQNSDLPGFGGTKANKKNPGIYTGSQLAKYDNQWRGAVALATHLKSVRQYNAGTKVNPQMKPVTRDVVYGALLKKYPNDPEFAGAAANIIFGQAVDDHDLHVLATKGVHPVNPFANSGVRAGNRLAGAIKVK